LPSGPQDWEAGTPAEPEIPRLSAVGKLNNSPSLSWPKGISYTFPGPASQVAQFQTWLNNCAAFAPQTIKNGSLNWEYNMSYLGANWDMGLFG
jgi:hypothetical protein